MGGGDYPEGAARRGERRLLRALPFGQQPHKQLVGPGYPQGWGHPETGNSMRHLWNQRLPPPRRAPRPQGATHPGGPATESCSSTASVTWRVQSGQ